MSYVGVTVMQDIKFPMSLDVFDLCTPELQQRLTPERDRFKAEEDKRVEIAQTVTPYPLFMVALWNRETIYIFMLWFVLSSFFFLA